LSSLLLQDVKSIAPKNEASIDNFFIL
jgi:hypothetical protein